MTGLPVRALSVQGPDSRLGAVAYNPDRFWVGCIDRLQYWSLARECFDRLKTLVEEWGPYEWPPVSDTRR